MGNEKMDRLDQRPDEPSLGVEGERGTSFHMMSTVERIRRESELGTNDVAVLQKKFDAMSVDKREIFLKKYGPPQEMLPYGAGADHRERWTQTQRISMLIQIHGLQQDWNKKIARRALVVAEITNIQNRLVEIGDVSMILHPLKWAEKQRLLKDLYDRQIKQSQYESDLRNDERAMINFGFRAPDEYVAFTPQELDPK